MSDFVMDTNYVSDTFRRMVRSHASFTQEELQDYICSLILDQLSCSIGSKVDSDFVIHFLSEIIYSVEYQFVRYERFDKE